MTPTPQERTEQDALALARRVIELEGANDPERIEVRLASALLSLAAQRAEKEYWTNAAADYAEKLAALESRYTALVTAARELIAHLDEHGAGSGAWFVRCRNLRDALGALLDSEASDQGVSE